MSKIIIDNHLIDLEMITEIKMDKSKAAFTLYFVGGHKIYIDRYFSSISSKGKKEIHFPIHWGAKAGKDKQKWFNSACSYKSVLKMNAIRKAELMFYTLLKKWSPAQVKFEDITIK